MLRRNFMWNIWFLSTEISRQVFPQRCWNFLIRENTRWSLLHDMIRLPASFFLHKLASLICKHLKPNSIAYDCFHVKYLILFDILGPQQKSCKIGARMTCNCLILSNSNHCFTWNIYAAVSACTNFGLSPDMFSDTKVLHWFSWAALPRQQALLRMIRYTEVRRRCSRNLCRLVSIKEVCFHEW